jgi:hypothetical protein
MPLSSTDLQSYRVYALIDPNNGLARYVGQTARTLFLRWKEHVQRPGYTKKGEWIRQLAEADKQPNIALLEEFTGYRRQAYERESYWIRRLRAAGHPLLRAPRAEIGGDKCDYRGQ